MISVENLAHSYAKNQQWAVKDISFVVRQGETFGFLGPSGAGKSTTQGILTGLLTLQQGQVTVDGYDIRKPDKKRFNHLGVSFEQSNVYAKLTAYENLKFYAGLFDQPTVEPMELLEMVGLKDKAKVKAGEFSKGMKHRLTFARSMINNPRLWFLDEPTTGLDPAIAADIKQIIKQRQKQGVTSFLTTHNMYIADELCDRVAFIIDGQIKVIDSPKNLKLAYGKKLVEVEYREGEELVKRAFQTSEAPEKAELADIISRCEIITLHSKEATLEEIFIQVTGKGLL